MKVIVQRVKWHKLRWQKLRKSTQSEFSAYPTTDTYKALLLNLRKQETQQNQMQISAYFIDVSSNYYFEYHTDFQDC